MTEGGSPETGRDPQARARAIVERVGRPLRAQVGEVTYRVEELTWPVSPNEDGSAAFASPHIALSLLRENAVLADVRQDYWDGKASFRVVGEVLGRWSRFRIGSPGERGWDLHLASDQELAAFAGDADELELAFGLTS